MTDDELDALFKRAGAAMLAYLDATVDTEAGLRKIREAADVPTDLYADGSSPAGEVTDNERT